MLVYILIFLLINSRNIWRRSVVGKVIKMIIFQAFSKLRLKYWRKSLVEKDNKVKVQGYDYVVQDINNENITLYSLLKIGDKLTLNTHTVLYQVL